MKLSYVVLAISISVFLTSCSKPNEVNLANKYGVLRVAIPLNCSIKLDELNIKNVKKVEIINFDLSTTEDYTNSYLHIEHVGYPSAILNPLNEKLAHCVPNTKVSYDSYQMFIHDLADYQKLSSNKVINIKIEAQTFTVNYHKDQE